MNHLSDSVSIVDGRYRATPAAVARHPHAADLRRAARHRLRRPDQRPRLHHHGAARAELLRRGQPDHRRARRAPSCRSTTPTNLGAALGGTPLATLAALRATRRARWRARRTGRASSPPRSTPATARRRSPEPIVSGNGGLPPPPAGSTPGAPGDRPDRQVQRHATGWTRSTATGTARCRSTCPTATSSSSTPTPTRPR